ncbi:tetratricopeptide repeat protein [Saccharopolyspora dendranthemae]|uniref:tetratricopeptide repeat protein n=1 Tax=Saccharopolyspora dendranthemae TaxID=1181886 RepID=UPI00164843AE|nr:tetratricopeptide repeat protein [Saccharopolyspora dendranthemae]
MSFLLSRQEWLLADNSPVRNVAEALSWLAAIATLLGAASGQAWRWLRRGARPAQGTLDGANATLAGRALFLINGALPKVSDVGLLDMRVKPAMDTETDEDLPPFVARDRDEDLEWALAQGGMVLLHGRAASGKTRAAAEALHRLCPDQQLVIPCNGSSLRAIADAGVDLTNAVIWLDDLERFLEPDGLDLGLLHRLCPQGANATIFSTIRDDVLAHYDNASIAGSKDESALAHNSVELIRHIRDRRRIRIDRYLSEDERARAHKIPDYRISAALDANEGFAEYLVAGRAMLGRWSTGDGALFQVGQAVISAAVDCRRAGYDEPIPTTTVEDLYRHYLTPDWRQRSDLPTAHDGIKWAEKLVLGANSCLQPHPESSVLAADYLADSTEIPGSPLAGTRVRPETWNAVLALSTPNEAIYIGLTAEYLDNTAVSTQAFLKAAEAGNAHAMYFLGMQFVERGSIPEGEAWYRKAAEAGHPKAMNNLGLLLDSRDETTEAETWYRKSAESNDHEAKTKGANNLAVLLLERGEKAESLSWYRKATEGGNPNVMYNLGLQLLEFDEAAEAESWYHKAAEAGHPKAMNNLALLLDARGETTEAETWYRKAAQSNDHEAMTKGANNIGLLLETRGETTEAESWYRKAAESDHVDSMNNLGLLLVNRGETTEAESWYRKAAESDHVDSMNNLGLLLVNRGETTEAESWYRKAAQTGNHGAMNNLGLLFANRGETTEAESWYRKAAQTGNHGAMFNLGFQLLQRGESTEAEDWYRKAAEAGDHRAMNNLGQLLDSRDETTEAEVWYRAGAQTGDPKAMSNLGLLLEDLGESTEAEDWYRKAAKAGYHKAMYVLGLLLLQRGESTEAEDWYRKAAEAGHPRAMNNLGLLLDSRDETTEAEDWYRKAAESNDNEAMTKGAKNLAKLLLGRNETAEAETWFRTSAEAGDNIAMYFLSALLHQRGETAEAEHWSSRTVLDSEGRPVPNTALP